MKSTILIVFGSPQARDNYRYHQMFEGKNVKRRTLELAEFPTFCIRLALVYQNLSGIRAECIIEDESIRKASGLIQVDWEKKKSSILIPRKDL